MEVDDLLGGYEVEWHLRTEIMKATKRMDARVWSEMTDEQRQQTVHMVVGAAREAYLAGQLQGIDDMAAKLKSMRDEAA
jgi:hypothetical protein